MGRAGPVHRESGFTRVVNYYGCLLVSPKEIDVQQRVRLTNVSSREAANASSSGRAISRLTDGNWGSNWSRRSRISGALNSRIRTWASNSEMGWYSVKLNTLGMKSAKPSVPARNTGIATSPQSPSHHRGLHPPDPRAAPHAVGNRVVNGEDRRRTQRVLLRVRANIHVALARQACVFRRDHAEREPSRRARDDG